MMKLKLLLSYVNGVLIMRRNASYMAENFILKKLSYIIISGIIGI